MNYRYRIEPSYGLIVDKYDGKVTLDDLFSSFKTCASDPDYRVRLNIISDMSTADPDFTIDELRKLAAIMDPDPPMKFSKIAMVAPETLKFGLFRMMGAVSEIFNIYEEFHVYSNTSEARSWLGLPEELDLEI